MEVEKPDTNDQESSNIETGTDDSKDSNNYESMDQTTTFEHVNTETDDLEDEHAGNSKDPFELTQDEKRLEAEQNKKDEDIFTQHEFKEGGIIVPDNDKDNDDLDQNQGDNQCGDNEVMLLEDSENPMLDKNKELDNVEGASSADGEIFNITFNVSGHPYVVNIQNVEITQQCKLCDKVALVKYNYIYKKEKRYLCSDQCLRLFKVEHNDVVVKEPFQKFFLPPLVNPLFKFSRLCKQCAATLSNVSGVISWEAMDFCKEPCLYRYQMSISKACAECGSSVAYSQLGKYAVRFGCIVRQFCSGACLETKKKKIRICSYCQKSIKRTKTTIGNKYFCNVICKGMYENLQMPKRPPYLSNPENTDCFVCKSGKEIRNEFNYHGTSFYFCSMHCFTVFKFIQCPDNCPKKCHTCSKYALQQYLEKHALYYDNLIHYFCSETCQHIYVITNRRVVPCLWCKVKKYNFDMIQKSNYLENTIYTCSIFCLNQLKASVKAAISTGKKCLQCGEVGIFELHLGGGAMATFCSNSCISSYQTQRAIAPVKRTRGRVRQIIPDKPGPLPVIANVCSLASNTTKAVSTEPTIKKIVIIKQQELPDMKNVTTSVTVDKSTRSTEIENIEKVSVECQTGVDKDMNIIPLMVPIYVPAPFQMWSAPIPKPVPFPLIIPCPVLIPTTKKTSVNLLKEVKKDTVKTPDDPFEAELLMMAELVAAEKKDEVEEPKSEEETTQTEEDDPPEEDNNESNHEFGEDMLEMALNMATNFTEPPVDLEGALQATTITPSQSNEIIEEDDVTHEIQRTSTRGRRRTRTQGRRGRRPAHTLAPEPEPELESIPQEPVEKPDAHMCLKYTFGVNAWKQWVTMKNAELERSSRRLKLFKPELLQLTSDELNYSLCLFLKEVRKPNGSEYAPDTIYYLCLGIQQYLYENGRIDNIFCDPYYDKFTECLNEVCMKFAALYSDSHYIVTRVEEEHLWESKQLGAHSPHVLLSTLMFFNTKYFNLTNVEEHMQLSFSHIMKHWKRVNQPGAPKIPGSRNVLLRFYPPQSTLDGNARKKKVYEQEENEENPLRCPVKLYEFYLSKCPESIKTRNDVFYLLPERSCVPDSPVWYSTMAMERSDLEKMLQRVKMVKEINVALLTN